jgi:hypothetical protein
MRDRNLLRVKSQGIPRAQQGLRWFSDSLVF